MSTNVAQVISTLSECMEAMKSYAGGSIPGSTSAQYSFWRSWIQRGQEDAAKRGFWRRLLVPKTITITKDVDYIDLPDNFHKVNGLYVLNVKGVDWAQPGNSDGQILYVYLDPTTATWKCKFKGFTPTETVADAELWYFYNPPKPVDENDPLYLDGEMIMFYALKEYFRTARQPGSMDDARIEYENRFQENLSLEVLPSRQELMSWSSYYSHLNRTTDERRYYSSSRRRRSF